MVGHNLVALGLTLAVELAVFLAVLPRHLRRDGLVCGVLVNAFSQPLGVLAHQHYHVPVVWVELSVVATEAALIRLLLPVGSAKALALAIAANLASWLAGRALGY